jgi:transcriptional regulator with XRE-family HTH domain
MNKPPIDLERLRKRVRTVIKESRTDCDMSQGELGKKAGMSRNQIANLETGRRDVQVSDFIVIATALGLDATILMGRICERRITVNGCPACRVGAKPDGDEQKWLTPVMQYSGLQHCNDCDSYFRRITFTAPMRIVIPTVSRQGRRPTSEVAP